MSQPVRIKSYAALVLSVICWGTSYVGTKVALEAFPPMVLAFLRFFLAGMLFFILVRARGGLRMGIKFHKKILLIALFLPGLYFIFENFGVKYTTAIKASLIAATVPVAVLLLSVLMRNESLNLKKLACLALSLCGIALLIFSNPGTGVDLKTLSIGDLLMVGAVFSGAVYIILTSRMSENYDSFAITSYQMIYGALFFLPFFAFQATEVDWAGVEARQWIALGALFLLATVGAFFTYNYALNTIPPSQAAMSINVVPFVTVLGSSIFLDEQLTYLQAIGGLLVISAAFMATLPQPARKKAAIKKR